MPCSNINSKWTINNSNKVEQRIYELLSQKFLLFDEVFGASDDIQPSKHFVTIQIIANKHSGNLKVMEPTKEDEWKWFDLNSFSLLKQ